MKILLVTPYFFEPHRWNISAYKTAHSLARIGINVIVFTARSEGQPFLEKVGSHLKIYRYSDLFIPDPANFGIIPFLSARLWKVVLQEAPTHFLVFTHMYHASLAVVLLKAMGKRVVVVTDTFPGIDWFSRSRLVNAVLWVYARTVGFLVLRLADHVVLLHRGLVPTAERMGLRFVVHPYGVEMHRYESPRPPADLEKEDGAIWVGYVGRLESVKAYDFILGAAATLTARHANVHFIFVGDVTGKDDVVERYQSPRIRFLGHRDDVPGILVKVDVFVLASLSEGLPSGLMEAMASGCACVATEVGGIPYLFSESPGEAGLLVPPGDPKALEEALEKLVNDGELRRSLGERARQVIHDHYRMDELAKGLVTILETTSTEP